MSARARVLLIIGVTILVGAGAMAYSISRFVEWHRAGWTGVYYAPEFPQTKTKGKLRTSSQNPGEVIMTHARSAADGRLLAHDRVMSVNGIPIEDIRRLRELEKTLHRGSTVVFRVQRGKQLVDVPIPLTSPFRNPYIIVRIVLAFIVAGTFVIVALVVFMRQKGDRRALVFCVLALVSVIAILGAAVTIYEASGGKGVTSSIGFNPASTILVILCSFAYAPLILHFSLIFPSERPILARRPTLLRWIYAGAVVAALIAVSMVLLAMKIFSDPANLQAVENQLDAIIEVVLLILTIGGPLMALLIIWLGRREGVLRAFGGRPILSVFALLGTYVAVAKLIGRYGPKMVAVIAGMASIVLPVAIIGSYPVFACVALVRSYRGAGVEEKSQVQWPLWGLLFALFTKFAVFAATITLGVYLQITKSSMMEWRGLFLTTSIVPLLATLAIPISFAAAILKYRLMNIDVIIRKTVVYAFLTGAIILVYLVLVGGLGTLLVNVAGVKNQTTVIASTLVVALLFVPLRNKLQTLVDRNLFRHKYEYPEALKAISAETLSANDLGTFLGSAAEKMQQALQNRAVVIFVPRHEELVAAAKVGVADSVVGTVRMARAPMVPLLDRPFDPRIQALPDDAAAALKRVEAVLIVPINTPGTPANGFIAVASKLARADFDAEDVAFLRSVADQLDLGLDRIRQQREETDYEQARGIQQSLLPREMPHVPGLELSGIWRPARTMGGDYYDLLKLDEHQIAVCIGDVAGKGMPAALLMSGLQAAVRASASDSPRDLCERVRRVVVSSLSGGRFVTFFYATIDTAAMRLRWCNAGHNAPVLARADGTTVRLVEGGPAFSRLFRDDRYEEREIAIGAGDRVVLFTDGVSEAAGGDGEMFGEERLQQLIADRRELGARELQETIVDAATAHSGGELDDDLTLVVVAVHGITQPA